MNTVIILVAHSSKCLVTVLNVELRPAWVTTRSNVSSALDSADTTG